jgi:hypothetical protein
MPANPKIFISYSHDSDEHCENVLKLSERLRQTAVLAGAMPAMKALQW